MLPTPSSSWVLAAILVPGNRASTSQAEHLRLLGPSLDFGASFMDLIRELSFDTLPAYVARLTAMRAEEVRSRAGVAVATGGSSIATTLSLAGANSGWN
jgi:hypothetical protein